MIHVTCRLTAKNRDQLRNPTLGNWIWATFTFLYLSVAPFGLQDVMCPWFCFWFRSYIYILFACLCRMLFRLSFFLHSFLTHLLPYLSFPLRIDPLHFQAGYRKRRLNLALVFLYCTTLGEEMHGVWSWGSKANRKTKEDLERCCPRGLSSS